jgi:hypothetical protein
MDTPLPRPDSGGGRRLLAARQGLGADRRHRRRGHSSADQLLLAALLAVVAPFSRSCRHPRHLGAGVGIARVGSATRTANCGSFHRHAVTFDDAGPTKTLIERQPAQVLDSRRNWSPRLSFRSVRVARRTQLVPGVSNKLSNDRLADQQASADLGSFSAQGRRTSPPSCFRDDEVAGSSPVTRPARLLGQTTVQRRNLPNATVTPRRP